MQHISDENLEMRRACYIKSGTVEDNLVLYIVMHFDQEGGEEEADDANSGLEVKCVGVSDEGSDEVIFNGRDMSREQL